MKRMNSLKSFLVVPLTILLGSLQAQVFEVVSPNGLLKLSMNVGATVEYSVIYNQTTLISPSAIALSLNTGLTLGQNGTVAGTSQRTVNETITPLYGKNKTLQ